MYSAYYRDGTVSVTAGSAAVTGSGTAWSLFSVVNGLFQLPGYPPLPVLSVQSDTQLTLMADWPHGNIVDSEYWIGLVSADQSTILKLNELQAQQLARGVLVKLNPDARGSQAGRAAYNAEPEGFIYGVNDNPPFYIYYEKASDTSGDWAGPFQWYGPQGDGVRGDPGAAQVVGTSTSAVTIGVGSKTFTIAQSDRGWGVGTRLRAASVADGENFMEGIVAAYSGSTLQLAVDLTGGAGAHADWSINVAGQSGQSLLYGDGAPSSGLGSDGDHYVDRLNLDLYGPKIAGAWGAAMPVVTAAYLQNIDGGDATSVFGGTTPIDGGDATAS